MTRYSEIAATGVSVLQSQAGTPVVYREPGRAGVEATALVGAERVEEMDTPEGTEWRMVCEVSFAKGEVDSPRIEAVVDIVGVAWVVVRIVSASDVFTRVEAHRVLPREFSREGYRRGRR